MIKTNKVDSTYVFIIGLGIIALFACADKIVISNYLSSEARSATIELVHPVYTEDFSDDQILVGAAHNVFIGRVIKQVGNKGRGYGPETQFKVQVIENIKGDLKGTVVVNQEAGYHNGKLVVVEGDKLTAKSNVESLLQEDTTYVFSTRYNETEDWYTLMSFPNANKVLTDQILNETEISSMINTNERVKKLKEAYIKEIPFEADILNNKIRNSYKEKEAKEAHIQNTQASSTKNIILEEIIANNTEASNKPN